MSHKSFMAFLMAARDDHSLLARYQVRNLEQMVFHARNEGYEFTSQEISQLVGALEASVVLTKDKSPFDGSAPLWGCLWGRRHLDYLVKEVVSRHNDDELSAIVNNIVAHQL